MRTEHFVNDLAAVLFRLSPDLPVVDVPESGIPLGILLYEGKIAERKTDTHWPPIQACTPNQTMDMTVRLKTSQ